MDFLDGVSLLTALERILGERQRSWIVAGAGVECLVVTAVLIEKAADGIFTFDIRFRGPAT